jgi:hypothetical protein
VAVIGGRIWGENPWACYAGIWGLEMRFLMRETFCEMLLNRIWISWKNVVSL